MQAAEKELHIQFIYLFIFPWASYPKEKICKIHKTLL